MYLQTLFWLWKQSYYRHKITTGLIFPPHTREVSFFFSCLPFFLFFCFLQPFLGWFHSPSVFWPKLIFWLLTVFFLFVCFFLFVFVCLFFLFVFFFCDHFKSGFTSDRFFSPPLVFGSPPFFFAIISLPSSFLTPTVFFAKTYILAPHRFFFLFVCFFCLFFSFFATISKTNMVVIFSLLVSLPIDFFLPHLFLAPHRFFCDHFTPQ